MLRTALMEKKNIVILGGGFAGLICAKHLSAEQFEVTLVDRWNHHLFQPLLYQVATAGLSAPEIAQPLRSILSDHKNVTTIMDQVVSVDLEKRTIELKAHHLSYDYLIIALGAKTGFFGNNHWEQFTLGLKSLDDAMRIRREVLLAFERAEASPNAKEVKRQMTLVVVGGGPTGVEMAGALAELSGVVLKGDFRHIDPTLTEVHLIEAGPRLLPTFEENLSAYTQTRLESLGVTVRLQSPVSEVGEGYVIAGGQRLESQVIIWAAGVEASPVTRTLADIPLDRGGRIQVLPDLSLPGHPEVFAAGDIVSLTDKNGVRVPGVSPAAIQMGQHIVKILNGGLKEGERPAYAYFDKGSMATIGRKAAVASIANRTVKGFPAWLLWLFVHLVFLIGMRNRISVFLHWVWSYFTWQRGARIIFGQPSDEKR